MSDDLKTDAPRSGSLASDSTSVGLGHRLDRAHTEFSSKLETASDAAESAESVPESAQTVDRHRDAQDKIEKVAAAGGARELGQERVLRQASQIFENLRKQYAEQDRREQRLNGQLALLDQERRNVRLWISQFEEEAEERDSRLQQQEADCTERLAQCAVVEQELENLRQTLTRQAAEAEALREKQQDEFQREQTLLHNRIRFQEEHLKKSRHELEQSREEFLREQQQAVQKREQMLVEFSLRRKQAERYRELLEQQEQSIVRERELLNKIRRANADQHEADRQRLLGEREIWNKERETQHGELKRQQNMLKLHAENLEARRLRLDRLRGELEDTHRKTLEMRLSVEEAWAQLAQSTGPDVAKQRVDEAQAALSEHFKQSREDVIQHRQELERAQARYQKQRDEFREERQALAEWVTERTEQLQERESRVNQLQETLEAREQSWVEAKERWSHEKAQAESVIRDLLGQLADLTGGEPNPSIANVEIPPSAPEEPESMTIAD